MLGWVLLGLAAGALLGAAFVAFWDDIRNWLNNTAANFVERVLGYGARTRMHRAISTIDRVMDVVRNRTIVYTKRNNLDTMYDKVTMEADAAPYEISSDVLKKIKDEGRMIQEFEYRQ